MAEQGRMVGVAHNGRFDVCIVGGSIAGSTLACHLSAEGFEVCVFEGRRLGERKLCAELTHIDVLEKIAALTGCDTCRDTISAKLDRVEVRAGRFELSRRFELGRGITVDRLALEALLLERAAHLGARVYRPVKVRSLAVSKDVVVVEAEEASVEAEVVVGADGAASLVGRLCSRPWKREEVGAARHVRLPLEPIALPSGPSTMRFDLLTTMAGYGWLVPYQAEIGLGAGGVLGSIEEPLAELLAEYGRVVDTTALQGRTLESLAYDSLRGAPVPVAGPSRSTWGDRFLLVGDAAGFVSPASGEGLSLAVSSVQSAASVLKLCFASGRFGGRKLRHYERLWQRDMPDFAALIRLRDTLAGALGLQYLEACSNDLERLALLAPLVGSSNLGASAITILDRLQKQLREERLDDGATS